MKDSEIINLYWERKESAITKTSEKYGSYCKTIAMNILNMAEDAEECVNDTWLSAWKSIPPHRPQCFSAYLGKITRNLSLNRLKQYSAQKRGLGQTELVLSELEDCVPSSTNVEDSVDEQVLVEAINSFLYAQPAEKRNIFIRRYWYLFSVKDIALAYSISESKVKSLLLRMRNDLKKYLESEGIYL